MTPVIAPSIKCDIKSDHGRVFENAPAKTRMQEVPQDVWQVIGGRVATIVTTADLAARDVLMMGSTCKGLHQATHIPIVDRVLDRAKNENDALLKIWKQISGNLNFDGNPPPQTLVGIKAWFEDPTNADQLNAFTRLDLVNLQLKAIPPQIAKFTQLKSLDLSHNQIKDISVVGSLVQMDCLHLDNNEIRDISAVRTLIQMKSLFLNNNQIKDISAVGEVVLLEVLDLSNNQIRDISALSRLTQLNQLSFSENLIADISVLAGLTELNNLYLNNNQIADISALRGLDQLVGLYLDYNQIADISALGQLTELTNLYLNNNQIADISSLKGLTELNILFLNNNLIADISSLEGLTQLNILFLNNNQIADISALGRQTQLTLLHLYNNQIVDISALGMLTQLNALYLHNNQIVDISVLRGLDHLMTLNISNNPIADITSLVGLARLQWLNIDNCALLCDFSDDYPNVLGRAVFDVILKKNIAFRDYGCQSTLSRFVQFLALGNSELEAIKTQFSKLDDQDKNLIYGMVYQASGLVIDDSKWEETHTFDDRRVFLHAVRRAIRTKFEQLSTDDINTVFDEVYKLAGSPQTKDFQQWGKRNATDNVLQLIDAMDMLNQKRKPVP